jgi:hypothetical protein
MVGSFPSTGDDARPRHVGRGLDAAPDDDGFASTTKTYRRLEGFSEAEPGSCDLHHIAAGVAMVRIEPQVSSFVVRVTCGGLPPHGTSCPDRRPIPDALCPPDQP